MQFWWILNIHKIEDCPHLIDLQLGVVLITRNEVWLDDIPKEYAFAVTCVYEQMMILTAITIIYLTIIKSSVCKF